MRGWGWVGVAFSFAGATLIALSEGAGLALSGGAGLVLVAALLLSLYSVIQKPLLAHYQPAQVATYAIWFGTLGLLPFAAGLPATLAAAPLEATLAVVFLGVGPAAIAYVTWSVALARLPASRAASFQYLTPAVALMVAWLWLGEQPHPIAFLGGLLAIGGVVLARWRD